MTESAKYLAPICRQVPRGMIIFFGSYRVLDIFKQALMSTQIRNLWVDKKFFFDGRPQKSIFNPKNGEIQVELNLLVAYSKYIRAGPGHSAVLCSVMGGILSEGINFKDDLARAVICVGVPFPNTRSAEIEQKIEYFKSK